MVKGVEDFKKLNGIISLPHALRTVLRIRLFIKIENFDYFVPMDLVSKEFKVKTIKKFLKDFINEELVERRVVMFHITEYGKRVIEKIRGLPDLQDVLGLVLSDNEIQHPHIQKIDQ